MSHPTLHTLSTKIARFGGGDNSIWSRPSDATLFINPPTTSVQIWSTYRDPVSNDSFAGSNSRYQGEMARQIERSRMTTRGRRKEVGWKGSQNLYLVIRVAKFCPASSRVWERPYSPLTTMPLSSVQSLHLRSQKTPACVVKSSPAATRSWNSETSSVCTMQVK